jgi:hypothetical protein
MKKLLSTLGLVVILALTVTPAFAQDPNPGNGNTDVVIMNMGGPTSATAVYYGPGGGFEFSADANLAVKGSFRFAASSATPLGDNWRGSMVVQSAGDVAAMAEILWTNGSSTDGTTGDAYTGFAAGATTMFVPYAVWNPTSQFTVFSVQNTDSTEANVQLTFFNRLGGSDLTVNDVIPALGSKSYDVRGFTQLQSTSFWTSNCAAGNCNWSGAVRVVSTNGKNITAAATNHWRQWAAAFNGVASGAGENFVSSVERRCVDCAWNPPQQTGNWRGFSIVSVQCVSATPCQVRFEFVGQTSTMANLTLPDMTVAPGAVVSANTRAGDSFNQALFNGLTNSSGGPAELNMWAGSVIVRTMNGTEIAAIAYNQRPENFLATGSNGVSSPNAGLSTYLPSIYKRGVCDGGFNWQRFSIIRIQNPTAANATDVDVYFYNRDGTVGASLLDRNIPAGRALTVHTRTDCSLLAGLGNNWEGGVYVASNQPLVAVAETYNNAFVVPSPSAGGWAAGYNSTSVTP